MSLRPGPENTWFLDGLTLYEHERSARPANPSLPQIPVSAAVGVSGTAIAYLRVSTDEQDTAMQRAAIERAGWAVSREFSDVGISGRTMSRPGLEACLTYLRDGDTLVIYSLSRLGRSTAATLELLEDLRGRGVRVVSITEQIDTGSAMGRFVTTLLAALAEMEAELTQERVLAGLAAARERGGELGRRRAVDEEMLAEARDRIGAGESVGMVATAMGVGRSTLYRALGT